MTSGPMTWTSTPGAAARASPEKSSPSLPVRVASRSPWTTRLPTHGTCAPSTRTRTASPTHTPRWAPQAPRPSDPGFVPWLSPLVLMQRFAFDYVRNPDGEHRFLERSAHPGRDRRRPRGRGQHPLRGHGTQRGPASVGGGYGGLVDRASSRAILQTARLCATPTSRSRSCPWAPWPPTRTTRAVRSPSYRRPAPPPSTRRRPWTVRVCRRDCTAWTCSRVMPAGVFG